MSKNKPSGEEKAKTSKSKQQVEPTELQRQPVAEVSRQGRTASPLSPGGGGSEVMSRQPSNLLSRQPSSLLSRQPSTIMQRQTSEGGESGGETVDDLPRVRLGGRTFAQFTGGTSSPPPIQPKLQLGPAGDKYEQEADRVARQVVRGLAAPAPALQRSAVRRPVHAFAIPPVQRDATDEEELQAKPNHGLEGGEVDTDVARSIQSAKGGGTPLHDGVRSSMEQGFGADFGGVRVHTGGQADALNRSLNARAFTTGSDIFFGKGEYNPGSSGGQELLAHELTHTVQQGAAGVQRDFRVDPPKIQREPSDIRNDYSDASVFSAGSMMDDEGNFAGPSLASHDAIKAELEEAGVASAERDIRVAMLTGKVADAWARKNAEQARLTEGNPDRAVHVIGVFTAPEWFFKNPGTPFSKDDKDYIVETFRAMSEQYTEMLIVPGTIVWTEGGGGWFAKRRKMYAHAPVLLNGHLVKMHQKMLNAADTQGYFGSTRNDSQDSNTYKKVAGGAGKSQNEMPTGKAERAYFRGQAQRTNDIHGERVDSDSSLFNVGNLNVSLEICGDHSSSGRAKAEKAALGDGYPGAHIQIVVSHGAAFTKIKSVLRPGGVAIANDGSNGVDASGATEEGAKGNRQVLQKGADNRFAAAANDSGSGEADLNKLHMGTYRLPT